MLDQQDFGPSLLQLFLLHWVTMLLMVMGEEAHEVLTTFTWEAAGDDYTTFKQYCQPCRNNPWKSTILIANYNNQGSSMTSNVLLC